VDALRYDDHQGRQRRDAPAAARRPRLNPVPYPLRQHRLEYQPDTENHAGEHPALPAQDSHRQRVDVEAALRPEQAVQHHQGDHQGEQHDGGRRHDPAAGQEQDERCDDEKQRHGGQQHVVADIHRDKVNPGQRRLGQSGAAQVAQADQAEDGRVGQSEPAGPTEKRFSGDGI
jgi:hypothetical protein